MKVIRSTTINNVLDKIGTKINSPEQRLLQGVVALGIQPFIDFRNKGTDDDTRAVSVARTIGKIIAGTSVGVCVRYASIAIAKKFSKCEIEIEEDLAGVKKITGFKKMKGKGIFTPDISKEVIGMELEKFERKYRNYTKTWGTILGVAAMVFTNFLIDVPITKIITKKLTPKVKAKIDNDNNKKSGKQVKNAV